MRCCNLRHLGQLLDRLRLLGLDGLRLLGLDGLRRLLDRLRLLRLGPLRLLLWLRLNVLRRLRLRLLILLRRLLPYSSTVLSFGHGRKLTRKNRPVLARC